MKERIKTVTTWLKSLDYRHYINVIITIGIIACGVFIFPNAVARFAESVRNVFVSCAYSVCEWVCKENPITPTVNNIQTWCFTPSKFAPLTLFPITWEEFTVKWALYWETFFSLETLLYYIIFLLECSTNLIYAVMFGFAIGVIAYKIFKRYLMKLF